MTQQFLCSIATMVDEVVNTFNVTLLVLSLNLRNGVTKK